MLGLVHSLVEVSSHTHNPRGVRDAAEVLRNSLPLAARELPSGDERYAPHLVLEGPSPASRGGVLLVGHVDTVFPRDRFAGFTLDGPLARGPGVLDMKGGLAVISFALRALREVGALRHVPFTLVCVSDEEVGSPTSTTAVLECARGARSALVFESGRPDDSIVTRRKGAATLTVRARGKLSHAGNAHAQGANALWALARWVDRAQSLTDYPRGVTVNVGTLHGGIGKNTVPDEGVAEVDLRFETLTDADSLREALVSHAREAAASVAGTELTLEWGPARPPMERTTESAHLRERYAMGQAAEQLGDGEMPLVGGGSDGCTTAAAGVPTIDGLGPRGRGFHTLDEHIEVASLVPKACALVRFIAGEGALV